MAIASVDDLIAGFNQMPPQFFHKAITPTLVSGRPQSSWGLGGIPGGGSFDTTLAGVALSSSSALVNGQIPFYNPSGTKLSYLSLFNAIFSGVGGRILLVDRLWHNGGFTITSGAAQTVDSATFPARDADGATSGKGVLLGVEISSAAGAAAPTITVSYTNSAGTSGRSATNAFATANSPGAGAFFPIGLQAGDVGVRSVQSLTLSASWLSGTMNLVAYRILAEVASPGASLGGPGADALRGGLPRMYDGTVPSLLLYPNGTTAGYLSGQMIVAQN